MTRNGSGTATNQPNLNATPKRLENIGTPTTEHYDKVHLVLAGTYPNTRDKIWLAINAYQEAKAAIVDENGIGEDLPFNLLGWVHDRLTVSCQISPTHGGTPDQKLMTLLTAAELMRTTWHTTAFTFMSEGYIAKNRDNIDTTQPFPTQFANGNPNIIESLIFAHIENTQTTVVNTPYKYQIGKKVSYSNPTITTTDNTGKLFTLLHQILALTPDPPQHNAYHQAVIDYLHTLHIDTHQFT